MTSVEVSELAAEYDQLKQRIRRACNPITGLTPAQYERHVHQIVQIVVEARLRRQPVVQPAAKEPVLW